ncbi:hypothetical protein GCE86_23355 [Micromonospora terminaliae]|uniref:Glycerophosphoryl diester phosphodiesterase membrane domain-containing protein n=1 Tax=Micromonospora terminaliae TaxID=1914461 RepID=A0AAJ2ZK85_9ACTN|nr:hypothetical protein [Micromonospora terminaliae]NES31483.1 hypothetical protein [Micromonospora terminaliae]QGL49705.1 hypothetical protein GCE86_23355 [Micromonospora terminaliae]
MSDLPPSGSAEPVPPASPGAPADPTRPVSPAQAVRPPAAGDTVVPAQPGPPAVPGPPVGPGGFAPPSQPGAAGQPWGPYPTEPAGPPVPGQPGATGQPGAPGQPWGPYPVDPAGPPQGWSWPTTPMPGAAYPYPMPGGAYPGYPMPGWHPGLDPQDPLVTPPHAGIGGWFGRCGGALRRGWRQLLPIMLLTQTVPAAAIAVISLALAPTDQPVTGPDGAPVLPDGYFEHIFAFYGAVLLAALIFGPLQSTGWAAGTWVVARQAAGEPVGVGAALRYGLRRALGLWGWTIVASLLITVGACLCLLPGLYAAFAFALFGPIYLFERQEPIGRAWRMFHQRFGLVLGRVALVICVLIVAAVLDGMVGLINQLVFGADPMAAPGTAAGAATLAVAGAVLTTPAYLAQLVGLVATYAEQRAHEGPVNAARLAAELG